MATTTYGSPYAQSADLVSTWPATSLSVADRIDDVSFKGNGLNNQTASYTGVLLDAGKTVMMNVATANTFTIPASGSIAYELGTVLRISNKGAGTTTVQPNGGVTLNGGNITLTQYQSCEVQLVAADIWVATVKPQTVTASGLTLITSTTFSAVSTVNVNNCFSASYENYFVNMTLTASSATDTTIGMRLRVGGVDNSGATAYADQIMYAYSTNLGASLTASSSWRFQDSSTTYATYNAVKMDIYKPFVAEKTRAVAQKGFIKNDGTNYVWNDYHWHDQSTAYDGFSLISSTGTITGTIRIYGYQNS